MGELIDIEPYRERKERRELEDLGDMVGSRFVSVQELEYVLTTMKKQQDNE